MHEIGQSIVRMASFTGKELREVVRRPGVLASLILGPFVIMFIFGLGYSGYREPFPTEIVIPEGNDLPSDPEYPTRHRDRDTVRGQLAHERVEPFPGRFACDKYAVARRRTSFSCSSSLIRLRASRSSADSARLAPGLAPSSTSA